MRSDPPSRHLPIHCLRPTDTAQRLCRAQVRVPLRNLARFPAASCSRLEFSRFITASMDGGRPSHEHLVRLRRAHRRTRRGGHDWVSTPSGPLSPTAAPHLCSSTPTATLIQRKHVRPRQLASDPRISDQHARPASALPSSSLPFPAGPAFAASTNAERTPTPRRCSPPSTPRPIVRARTAQEVAAWEGIESEIELEEIRV
ncbi:hypothetical protein DFH09DRAFT_1345261 [Mycena vulgaris]|nr:hypothetical protein DFH09DRAFT_1345261 [Mycena vulgaris]